MNTEGKHTPGPMLHMQLSVDAARWPDHLLEGYFEETMDDGTQRRLSGPEVREYLQDLKRQGFEVVPCSECETDPKTGRCLGRKRTIEKAEGQ